MMMNSEETKSPWISVNERLPELIDGDPIEVLIATKQYFEVGFYNADHEKWYDQEGTREIKDVLYWMPIPRLPND